MLGQSSTLVTTEPEVGSGYEAWDGTSMATPHVSGVAALIWSADPSLTNVQIREAMDATAEDLGDPGRDVYYGYGLVQAKAALDLLIEEPPAAQLMVDVSTNQTVYSNRENVVITVVVENQAGALVEGAAVDVTVLPPKGKAIHMSGVSDADGKVVFKIKVNTGKNGAGTYDVEAVAAMDGYASGTGSTSFTVN